jgi:hypothetical protein
MSSNRGRSYGDDTGPRPRTDDVANDYYDAADDDELDDEAGFTEEDTGFDPNALDVHAADEIGDPYAVNSLDDLAKDGSEDLPSYAAYDSTLGLSQVEEADRRPTESGTWDTGSEEARDSAAPTFRREVSEDDGDESVWTRSSESVNAPLFHSAELKQTDTGSSPWDPADSPFSGDKPFESVIQTMEAISEERYTTEPSGERQSPPPTPEFLGGAPASEFFGEEREPSYSDHAFEVESQDVVYEQSQAARFKDRIRDRKFMKRSGQVAIASIIGLVLGWMAWGGGDEPTDPDAGPEVAAVADAGTVEVESGEARALEAKPAPEKAKPAPADEPDVVAGDAGVFAVDDEDKIAKAAAVDAGCAVIIHSKPIGASVWVKDEVIGKTPFRGKLPCQKTAFRIKRDNYRPVETERRLRDDGLNKINVELERPNYRVRVTSVPSRAVVKVNGKVKGRTPLALKLPGYTKAKIVIDRPGHRTWKRTMIPQTAGEVVKAKLQPTKKKSKKRRTDG